MKQTSHQDDCAWTPEQCAALQRGREISDALDDEFFGPLAIGIPLPFGRGRFVVSSVSFIGRLIVASRVAIPAAKATQVATRGWTIQSIRQAIRSPALVGTSRNFANGNPATAYFRSSNQYVVIDDVTGEIVHVSNLSDANWRVHYQISNYPKAVIGTCMTDSYAYSRLPPELLATATERGGEMAWDVDDIPRVIEAAARAGLVNLGGQLQFRIPDGGTCEVPWVEVNTHNAAPPSLAWDIRVQKAAQAALDDFDALRTRVNFLQEGLRGFPDQLREYEAKGGKAEAALCFVWYVVRKRA